MREVGTFCTRLGRILLQDMCLSSFRALSTGEKGISPVSGQPLYYKNSIIHRSIKDFMIQGGGERYTYLPRNHCADTL